MPSPSRAPGARLLLEALEARENPSGLLETFDVVTTPSLPTGWAAWSTDGTNVFVVAAGKGVGGSGGVVSSGISSTIGLAWQTPLVAGDTGAAASVKLDTLVPTFVFARGTNLGTVTPNFV